MYIALTEKYLRYLENEDDYVFIPQMWSVYEEHEIPEGEFQESFAVNGEGSDWAEQYLHDWGSGYDLCNGSASGLAKDYTMYEAYEYLRDNYIPKTTVESILRRLDEAVKGTLYDFYPEEYVTPWADQHTVTWDEDTSGEEIANTFVDDNWSGEHWCRRCSSCGRLMDSGYHFVGRKKYYCSRECLSFAETLYEDYDYIEY